MQRERDTQTETETQTDRQTDRQDAERDRERHRHRRDTDTDTERQTDRVIDRLLDVGRCRCPHTGHSTFVFCSLYVFRHSSAVFCTAHCAPDLARDHAPEKCPLLLLLLLQRYPHLSLGAPPVHHLTRPPFVSVSPWLFSPPRSTPPHPSLSLSLILSL